MEAFQPLVGMLTMLTVLSLLAERVTNVIKMWNEELADAKGKYEKVRVRIRAVQTRSIWAGVGVALVAKADIFSMIANISEPWRTLGWVRLTGEHWSQSAALSGWGEALYAVGGCLITGVALGFGSKFWHDILGAVYELRSLSRVKAGNDDRSVSKVMAARVAAPLAGDKGGSP